MVDSLCASIILGVVESQMLTVFFTIDGHERTRQLPTLNANFARFQIERAYPGAIVTNILPGKVR